VHGGNWNNVFTGEDTLMAEVCNHLSTGDYCQHCWQIISTTDWCI